MVEKLEELLETKLTDSGDNWKGLCPFHDENTASFYIHKEDLICHCFGCGVAGSISSIVAQKQRISVENARKLLNLTALDLETRRKQREKPETPRVFPESWLAPWPAIKMHPYLEKRGFTANTIQMASARWDETTRRIVFPMWYQGSALYGAVGRATDEREPKWYFYWKCEKSRYLWHPAWMTFQPRGPICVVEGVFDALWLIQHGMYAVALMGSKPSKSQIGQLRGAADDLILMLDNDQAGHTGVDILEAALRDTCRIHHVEWPDYANDPMDLDKDELDRVLSSLQSPLERKLRATAR